MAAKKGNILPKRGNILPKKGDNLHFADKPPSATYYKYGIARALREELGGNHKSEKTLMRWTGASERTVKNWVAGLRGPSGAHLIALMRNSDVTFEAVLIIAGRSRTIASQNMASARVHLLELLALLDAETGRLANDA